MTTITINSTLMNITEAAILLAGARTEGITNDDAAWALACSFLILTMQTGFAMLECGCVSSKNIANIMIKNVVDVCLGGLSYWLFGYGLSFGHPSNAFCGYGNFFFTIPESMGDVGTQYSKYFFQFSFASTATTIVSGAVAERMKLHSYMIFAFTNTLVYCFPASWAWNAGMIPWDNDAGFHGNSGGFLYKLGFYDFAGTCVVHLSGGCSAMVAAAMLGPRTGRFKDRKAFIMSSPVTALTGMFMLWWAWLGFNCGSTFGVSGELWKVTALVAVTTLNGAIGGGVIGLGMSMGMNKGKVMIDYVINSVLGGLVAITGIASVTTPFEALVIGCIGGLIAASGGFLMEYLLIDDPVGAVPVHFFAAVWGTLSVAIFGKDNKVGLLRGRNGVLHHGDIEFLGVQILGILCIAAWSAGSTFSMFWITSRILGMRMSAEDELLGADWVEHEIHSESVANRLEKTLSQLDEEHWDGFVSRLYKEVTTTDTHPIHARHRVYSIDQGKSDRRDTKENQAVVNAIVQSRKSIADGNHNPLKRQNTLRTIKNEMSGMYSYLKQAKHQENNQNGDIPGQPSH